MKRFYPLFILLLLGFLLIGVSAWAQPGGGYELVRSSVGGGAASGGGYEVAAVIGQAEVGASSGGAYDLTGGFWETGISGEVSRQYYLYLPLSVR
jgi:hypothetical protein